MSNKKDSDNNLIDTPPKQEVDLTAHWQPEDFSDLFAHTTSKCLKWVADVFFQKRYGHRAVVLETIAAVPGMIAAMLTHFRCLRTQADDNGWIKSLLEEAENERMHLMTFIEIAKPSLVERLIIILAQIFFTGFFFLVYVISSKTAHRLVGYLEEEAVNSYDSYLKEIDEGNIPNTPAPTIAINYWGLEQGARLRDVVLAVQKDEARHRDANHEFADILAK